MNVIEAHQLRREFRGGVVAVDGIDLTIRAGEVVAVLGPNGAGKTTTIEMMLGLRTPTSGQISVFGQPPGTPEVRARVGAMLQDTDAPDGLTVREIVKLVSTYYPHVLPVDDVLKSTGLTEHAKKKVHQLSGGLRQRLSLAVALIGDPDLLYLDEPTSALDVSARAAMWRHIRSLADLGKTIVFSTHHLDEADEHADRIVLFSQGRIIRDGTPRDIKAAAAAKVVEVTTDAAPATVEGWDGVLSVMAVPSTPDRLRIQASAAEPVVARLFGEYRVADLVVSETDLEQAFIHLTDPAAQADSVDSAHDPQEVTA